VLGADVAGAAPPNDDFTNAIVLTGTTNFVASNNAGATSESGEPSHADSGASSSVWWSWQAPFTGSVSISTAGSTFDTLLAVYTGDSVSNLQAVADNDDAGGFGVVFSSLVFRALAGETYRIAVDGFNGATGSVRLALGPAGYPAPYWMLHDLNGQVVTANDFSNRVLVIDFWETTCGACVDELPYLKQLHYNLSSEGFTFFGVSMDPPSVNLAYFVQTQRIPYLVARGDEAIDDAFGSNVPFPTKFVIDRENKVVGQYSIGGVDYNYYAKIIKPLLRGSNKVPLDVRRDNGARVVSWPAIEFGYQLEARNALGSGVWSVAASPVVMSNGQNTVVIPVADGAQFFRLRKNLPH
jgi:thiol-disulfide isomerase/thioredoxin